MEMTVPCSAHRLVRMLNRKPDQGSTAPRYPATERHPIRARESYAESVIRRRRRQIAAQSFARLVAEARTIATARKRLSAWLDSTEKTLNHLKKLEANWDGYGASPINTAVISEVRELIVTVADRIIEAPTIVPTSRGGIQLEWHRGSRCLELEFESQASIHYLKWDPAARVEEEDFVPIYAEDKIFALLDWFEKK